jgi:hypothetical protein
VVATASWKSVGCSAIALTVFIVWCSNAVSSNTSAPPVAEHPSSGTGHITTASIVWKSKEAFDAGTKLMVNGAAKTHPELVLPLSACAAQIGDALTVLDRGFSTREIILDSGKSKGCRGWVEMEAVGR